MIIYDVFKFNSDFLLQNIVRINDFCRGNMYCGEEVIKQLTQEAKC